MEKLQEFMDFEKGITKTKRGNKTMYDVKGHYKYLSMSGLFDYYINTLKK